MAVLLSVLLCFELKDVLTEDISLKFNTLNGQCVCGKPFKFVIISLPVKSLMYHKFTIIYEVYN